MRCVPNDKERIVSASRGLSSSRNVKLNSALGKEMLAIRGAFAPVTNSRSAVRRGGKFGAIAPRKKIFASQRAAVFQRGQLSPHVGQARRREPRADECFAFAGGC